VDGGGDHKFSTASVPVQRDAGPTHAVPAVIDLVDLDAEGDDIFFADTTLPARPHSKRNQKEPDNDSDSIDQATVDAWNKLLDGGGTRVLKSGSKSKRTSQVQRRRSNMERVNTVLDMDMETEEHQLAEVSPEFGDGDNCRPQEKYLGLGRKILVFAHHKVILDAVEGCLREQAVKYVRIDGGVSVPLRAKLIDRFQQDDEVSGMRGGTPSA